MSAEQLLAAVLLSLDRSGTLFGGYVLYEKLGRGGFGVVFRARRLGTDEDVALKQMRGSDHATAAERREFLAGAETMKALDHPGIVRVLDVGESEGCPFFTMPLVRGGDLETALQERPPPSQSQAARWIRSIALAVHHAHSREVLHCDLKPANILLDENDEPLLTDFGSARRMSKQGECIESGEGVLGYGMAPEQASGSVRNLTRRADIFSLGVILYDLLTGRVPYEGLSFADWVSELVSAEPIRLPRVVEPKVNRDLALICLKCLEKDPNQRYESAALLADDLDLVVYGWHPRHARVGSAPSRSLRWLRRNPARPALIAAAVLVLAVLVVTRVLLLQSAEEQQRAALQTNAFIANSEAGALLFQLREFAERVERCTQKPIAKAVLTGSVGGFVPELEVCARGFQEVNVMSAEGRELAQWPEPKERTLGRTYSFRDYFDGARYLAVHGLPGAYLSPAYRSESSHQIDFAFSAPMLGSNGEWLGMVVAAQRVDSTMGQLPMSDTAESGRIVALLGPRGKDRSEASSQSSDFYFIAHPRLARGLEVPLQDPNRAQLDSAFGVTATIGDQFSLRWVPPLLLQDYHDPLLDRGQSSLAAFSPVGRTGYIVIVQTAKDALQRDNRALEHKLIWRAAVPLVAGLALLALGVFSTARRKRSLEVRIGRRASPSPKNAVP